MKRTVEVTQADIDAALENNGVASCCGCPIARAATRVFGGGCAVSNKKLYAPDDLFVLPYEATKFVTMFDDCLPVQPFTFQVSE